MIRKVLMATAIVLCTTMGANAQTKLPTKWEELTAADFRQVVQHAKGACLLPFGIMEKHGPHLLLGNDLINARYAALQAASQEYVIVFPESYCGHIFGATTET